MVCVCQIHGSLNIMGWCFTLCKNCFILIITLCCHRSSPPPFKFIMLAALQIFSDSYHYYTLYYVSMRYAEVNTVCVCVYALTIYMYA